MKNNPKTLFAWCMYDWANSVHALVIVSAIFPVYFGSVTTSTNGNQNVDFLGYTLKNSVLFSYTISFSFLLIALFNPLLTGIADYSGKKKSFMRFFVYLGSVATAGLFFFTSDSLTLGIGLFSLSLIGYTGSIVFYNAYLPEIATEERFDALSAKGYAYGYVGSVLLMLLCLVLIMFGEKWGWMKESMAVRTSFLLSGLWWWGFAQYTFWHLPTSTQKPTQSSRWLLNGWKELQKVIRETRQQTLLKRYLVAFFFFNMGVQTVMYIAAVFGESELRIPGNFLLITVLLIQLLAIFGSLFFAWLSAQWGNTQALRVIVVIWIGICVTALYINQLGFYILAVVIGFVMGGVQALSRATYAKLMPEDTPDKASYFGFYDIADKMAIVLGTFSYGLIQQLTGSVRNSIAILAMYFVIGLVLLFRIPSQKRYH